MQYLDDYTVLDGRGKFKTFDGPDLTTQKHDWPVMQYTGLKDKNGKEIYEGDILKNIRHGAQLIEVYWEGIRAKQMGWLDYGGWKFRKIVNDGKMTYATYDGDIEVIGNIYENPELVEELK
jgi:uncharacterized phage protein (TIGR01671 family)